MLKKIIIFIFTLGTLIVQLDSLAAVKKKCKHSIVAGPKIQTSLIIDTNTRKILHAQNIRERVHPASITKVMTGYLLFEAIKYGKLSLDTKLYASKKAENVVPLKLGVKAGTYITVREAIPALIVHSANDVAIMIAENMAGSEERFARLMNIKAKQLGMRDTVFKNPSGLHDQEQKTTAVDIAVLSFALQRDYPQYYNFFSTTSFDFRGRTIYGHNRVIKNYDGVKYSKTGFTTASGFNIVVAASKGNKSLLGVVTGCSSYAIRDKKIMDLFDKYFGIKAVTVKRGKVRNARFVSNDKFQKILLEKRT